MLLDTQCRCERIRTRRPNDAATGARLPVVAGGWADQLFTVVDCETTGLCPDHDRIVEVAVLVVDCRGVVQSSWSTLVRPTDRPLVGRLTAVVDAPTFGDVAGDLCTWLSSGVIVGHNVGFDLRIIAELGRVGAALPTLVTSTPTRRRRS